MGCAQSKGNNLPIGHERESQRSLQALNQQTHDMLPAGVAKCVASARHVTDAGCEVSSWETFLIAVTSGPVGTGACLLGGKMAGM
jgi:hypothetical protein